MAKLLFKAAVVAISATLWIGAADAALFKIEGSFSGANFDGGGFVEPDPLPEISFTGFVSVNDPFGDVFVTAPLLHLDPFVVGGKTFEANGSTKFLLSQFSMLGPVPLIGVVIGDSDPGAIMYGTDDVAARFQADYNDGNLGDAISGTVTLPLVGLSMTNVGRGSVYHATQLTGSVQITGIPLGGSGTFLLAGLIFAAVGRLVKSG